MDSPLVTQLTGALGPGYSIERELEGGGMSRVFVALDEALQRRVAVKVLPEHLAAAVSVDRFNREILLSAGLQHPHIVGVLSAGLANGQPFFVMPYVEGESLGARLARDGRLSVRDTVSILKDVCRALAYAHERGVVHRDIKPHNILLAAGAATVTDFGVAKALSSARRSGDRTGALTGTGMSLGTPLYMAPEQAAADPDVDHRADIYALGITAYEMLTGKAPFAGLAPRAMLAARMTEDPPGVETKRADVPAALASLVRRCLAREPADRPQSAADLLAALDDPAVVSGTFAVPRRRTPVLGALRGWPGLVAAGVVVAALAAAISLGRARTAAGGAAAPAAATASVPAPSPASVVILPLVNIGTDSANAYLAEGITNELAAALGRVKGVRVVSPTRAAAMLAAGKPVTDIGRELNVALQLEGTVQREGKRLRVTARLVDVRDGVMRWSDMYERDATDLMTVQDELTRAITLAVGSEMRGAVAGVPVADGSTPAAASPAVAEAGAGAGGGSASAAAYDAYLRGRFQLARHDEKSLRRAMVHFGEAVAKDPKLAVAWSGLAEAQGLLPVYGSAPAEPALQAALRHADRAVALDSTVPEVWATRGALHARSWHWADAERDFRRALAIKGNYAAALQGLGELLLVTGRAREGITYLDRSAKLEPTSPSRAASLGVALALAGHGKEGTATAERAVAYDSTLSVSRTMLGMARLYLRQPVQAIPVLEEAVRMDPESPAALGALGFAYASANDVAAARRTAARVEALSARTGKDVALARIALGLRDTARALAHLERAARARDPFFAEESTFSPLFDAVRASPRFAAVMRNVLNARR